MKVTPIINRSIIMRYRKIDKKNVIDSLTNEVYNTVNADKLIKKLNKRGMMNAFIIDNNNKLPKHKHMRLLDVII